MTLLHEAVELKKMDTRVSERNLDRGLLNAKDLDKAVRDLPDDSANAEYISIESLMDDSKDASH